MGSKKGAASTGAGACALGVLGIAPSEEAAYQALLVRPGERLAGIAGELKLSQRAADKLLRALEAKGLVSRTPENPSRYHATAPDIVMDTLLLERQQELQRARAAIEAMKDKATSLRPAAKQQMVELITSGEAERHVFHSMNRKAKHEVLTLVRRPILISNLHDPRHADSQREAQQRGVAFRSIVDHDALAMPGLARSTLADMESGEAVRVLPMLPFKMVIADRSLALVPLNPGGADGRVLLVRESALLDALYALFDALWRQATPMSVSPSGAIEASDPTPALAEESMQLVSLLAGGLNDKMIASELDVSTRTLDRRILKVMKSLDARTRFQAGWIAALRAPQLLRKTDV